NHNTRTKFGNTNNCWSHHICDRKAYPWLIFCGAFVFATLRKVIYAIIDSAKGKISGEETAARITTFLLITIVEGVIYWFSLTVYKKLRNEAKSAKSDYTSVPNSSV
ncbi:hypothetical protein FF38_01599, partial [Lucilia cuprina]